MNLKFPIKFELTADSGSAIEQNKTIIVNLDEV
jgi:hypothetical protein